jgi:hypothetical protein
MHACFTLPAPAVHDDFHPASRRLHADFTPT